jgi:hypothetical protein
MAACLVSTLMLMLMLLAAPPAAAAPLNLRPIIGIVANGPNDTSILPPYDVHDAYIAASYVKHVEAAGGRAVPIPWFLPADEVRALAKSLNGFLLPGGGTHFFQANGSLSGYGATTKILFDETVAAWAAGETLPLWGTCLGHEMTLTHAAGDSRTLDKFGYVSGGAHERERAHAQACANACARSSPARTRAHAFFLWRPNAGCRERLVSDFPDARGGLLAPMGLGTRRSSGSHYNVERDHQPTRVRHFLVGLHGLARREPPVHSLN